MEFARFQWWSIPIWGGKENGRDDNSSEISSYSLLSDPNTVNFPSHIQTRTNYTTHRKVKKKWESREDRRNDKENDVVLVPIDGVYLSCSETDDSDWSIGWLEPHASDFLSDDDETDDSFAVLVRCYRNDIINLTNEHFREENFFMEKWLSSLHNF